MKEIRNEIPDYAERWRPQIHFSTLDSRINDPNGLVYYKGVYHLYYQCQPHGENIGKHWGHAVSDDLIHWKEVDLALFPDDVGHMWSGTAAVDVDNTGGFFTDTPEKQGIVAAYSTNTQHIGIAYSTDGGMTFQKVSTTEPVLRNPDIRAFRDPHLFWHPETNRWKMAVAGKGGVLWIYESADLRHWNFCSKDARYNTECPNLFRMRVEGSTEEKRILSCVGREYYVGSFDGYRFIPETGRISMQEGPDAYAGITFSNMPDGRTVMISWMNSFHPVADGKWNGCLTVPVEMKLVRTAAGYRLLQSPVRELSAATGKNLLSVRDRVYESGCHTLPGVASNCFELTAEIDLQNPVPFSLTVCEGAGEGTVISYDPNSGCITVDRSRSLTGPAEMRLQNALYSFYVDPASIRENILRLRLLADVSNVELFVNDGYYYFVMRIHPLPTSRSMSLRCDGSLQIRSLTVNECRSIWFAEPPTAADSVPDDPVPTAARKEVFCEVSNLIPDWYAAHATVWKDSVYVHKFGSGAAAMLENGLGDFSFTADVTQTGVGIADVLFRLTDTDNYFCLRLDGRAGKIALLRKAGGIAEEIASSPMQFAVNTPCALRLQAIGDKIEAYVSGTCLIRASDGTFTSGQLGLCVHIADALFENLFVTRMQ